MARRYAIASRDEALAYLEHPTLGPRLRECTQMLCGIEDRSIGEILGSPDDLKFRSSMTLFKAVSGDPVFRNALDKFCAGGSDPATTTILQKQSPLEGSAANTKSPLIGESTDTLMMIAACD
jgi:uncharacterized protein (DUF1810 family)